ncbi:acetyl-CoA carboxylase biotin carboxyl carrier protein [Streptomyces iranensis]|uniref:Biotin carboxyl carrier protein of acetyl-CoA carboxylase n=1 Tax=Streptomyces iranensis TaxID=576784 RepID=A0A060ZKQ0_9ACTN|nr:biotin/lipoyl-containing protein [Streptomyces iranensis]MBP2060878.1 acetyl-CoA carboxylase biotin carboxyl carrier protein [Streptomyces iranensis]CDR06339.1 biotin/lipoyl attachment domain-containingprotein [Streptomyces iranensis]
MRDSETTVDVAGVHQLSSALRAVVESLPGPVRQVTVRAGECSIDVSWDAPAAVTAPPPPGPVLAAPWEESPGEPDDGTLTVRSPLVGTFYRGPSPEESAFVEVGDVVEPGQQIALVEAMKLFTPITMDTRGRITAVHVADGDMVEYDQPLIDYVPVEG